MPSASELIAHDRSEEEVGQLIGADWLVYQDLDALIDCSLEGNPEAGGFDCSVFNGEYITGDVDQNYLDWVESLRNDDVQSERREAEQAEGAVVGLHNDS
jgi:amidophosphoribosyltransferase